MSIEIHVFTPKNTFDRDAAYLLKCVGSNVVLENINLENSVMGSWSFPNEMAAGMVFQSVVAYTSSIFSVPQVLENAAQQIKGGKRIV